MERSDIIEVLIKGELPKSCDECIFCHNLDSRGHYSDRCWITDEIVRSWNPIPANCPLTIKEMSCDGK